MGIPTKVAISIADALFSKVQQRVLTVLFGNPDRSFYANEIIGLIGMGTGAVQRELVKLESSGLITAKRIGNQKHFQANRSSPVFTELRNLILKTSGLADIIRNALLPFIQQIDTAFIYGSVAKGTDTAQSDIDLMIVSDSLTYAEVFPTLEETGHEAGRPINPTIYSSSEFQSRIDKHSSFLKRVIEQPKLWIIGSENDLTSA